MGREYKQSFMNSFVGSDSPDIHAWADHLKEHFPDEFAGIEQAQKLKPDRIRDITLQRVVEQSIDSLLRRSDPDKAGQSEFQSGGPDRNVDADRASQRTSRLVNPLHKVPDEQLAKLALQRGVSIDELRQNISFQIFKGSALD